MTGLRDQRGFTLVETLVVMLIIGILATLAIALYSGQRARGQDAEAKAAATLVMTAMLVYQQEHETFAGADAEALTRIESAVANIPEFTLDPAATSFEVVVTSRSGEQGGGPFTVTYSNAGGTRRTCGAPGRGACSDSGTW